MKYFTLILNNFKSFIGKHEFLLDREPGLYYIAGMNKITGDSNGSGKSSLVGDTLTWVRFGRTGRDSRPGKAVVPWKVKGTTSVELIFEGIDGKTRQLIRSRNPNKLKMGYIYDNLKDVTQEDVDRMFGDSEEMFRRAEVLAQFDTFFLDMRPEQQSQMFTDALNLDVWLRAAELASKKVRTTRNELNDITIQKSRVLGQIKEVKHNLDNEQNDARLFAKYQASKRKEAKHQLRLKLEDLQTRVKALPLPKGGLPPSSTPAQRSSGLGYAGKGGLAATPLAPPTPAMAVAPALARLVRAAKALPPKLKAARARFLIYEAKHLQHKRVLDEEATKRDKYKAAITGNQKCPECGQMAPLNHLQNKLNISLLRAAHARSQIQNDSSAVTRLRDSITRLENEIERYNKLELEFKKYEQEIIQLDSSIKILNNGYNPHENNVDNLLSRLKKLRTNKQSYNDQLTKIESDIETYKFWAEAFKTIRLELIDDTLTELEMVTLQHTEALGLEDWNIKFNTERESKSGNVTTAFSASLYPPGMKEPVKWQSYCGGESQRWQLSVALGLSDVILARMGIHPNIEVYDEPTKGMSPEGTGLLLEHLKERALELRKAIYVIEHHSLDRGMFDDTITIIKDKNGSRIKQKEPRL